MIPFAKDIYIIEEKLLQSCEHGAIVLICSKHTNLTFSMIIVTHLQQQSVLYILGSLTSYRYLSIN